MPKPSILPKFTPCLWFDGKAEEAAKFYCSVFPRSKVLALQRAPSDYPEGGREGQVLVAEFLLDGQRFVGLNGGPLFKFTEAVSIMVDVSTQKEYDRITDALSAVPEAEQCGWIKDRYGLSWQVVPRQLMAYLGDPDRNVTKKVFEAMMPMKRIDIARIEAVAADARAEAKRPSRPRAQTASRDVRPKSSPRKAVAAATSKGGSASRGRRS